MERTGRYTPGEEIANALTHGLGVLAAAAGLVVLLRRALQSGRAVAVVAAAVFGVTVLLLFAASTLYHAIPEGRATSWLRLLDHAAIYLLIAGTYTPFTLITLRGAWGWSIFGAVWVLALLGLAGQAGLLRRRRWIEVILYLVMGWVVIVALKPLVAALPPAGLALLVAGGMAYTVGVAFYLWRSLPYHHAVWHLFVLAGAACHFLAILLYVIPRAAGSLPPSVPAG